MPLVKGEIWTHTRTHRGKRERASHVKMSYGAKEVP